MALYPIIIQVPPDIQATKGRPKVQALSRLARQAAQQSAQRSLGHALSGFPKSGAGVPQPVNGIHWSLSHKSALVAGIVAPQAVGIDVEYCRPVKAGMFARIASEKEWALGRGADRGDAALAEEGVFHRFWTAKEAVLKAVGHGLTGLSRCRIIAVPSPHRIHLTYAGAPWRVVQHWYDRHLVAVALQHLPEEGEQIHWPPPPRRW
ncbi:MAG: 4'-phosphopantetheinyl transferase superfamily protein [Desulfosarcinaceae bacterium]|nr:4'-phosphopantetheinyl transferase superfamily protein [Desulfosarcinaceae bacterium]